MDGLRAVAALAVVGFHLRLAGFGGGSFGVDIFFVLSGFLITTILLMDLDGLGRIGFRVFYLKRALRLFPAYVAVLVVSVLASLVLHVDGTLNGAGVSAFYVANWAIASGHAGLGMLYHTWSLSIEEQFYLLWPALLMLLHRRWRGPRGLAVAVGCLTGLCWLAAGGAAALRLPLPILLQATPLRSTELLGGALLACCYPTVSRSLGSDFRAAVIGSLALVALVIVIPVAHPDGAWQAIGVWALISLLTCAVIATSSAKQALSTRLLSWRPLVQVGKMSYGLYLWHFPILVAVDATLGLSSIGPRLLALTLTVVVTTVSYHFLERPFLALKERVGASHTPPSTTPTPQGARPPDPASA